jgi:hypothetical protein
MAGIGAAVAARHHARLLGKHVNDLSLTFVAPLATDHRYYRQVILLNSCQPSAFSLSFKRPISE